MLVVTKSLFGYVSNQVQCDMESAIFHLFIYYYYNTIPSPKYYTHILQHNITLLIPTVILVYHSTTTLTNQILIHSPRHAVMIFCSIAIVT